MMWYDMIWCVYIYIHIHSIYVCIYIYIICDVEYVLECFPTPVKLQNSNKNPKWVAFRLFLQNFVQKCPFRPASGIFFMASLTFPMDPKRSPKFGVAARRGSIGTVSSSRPCAVEPQKAQRIALPAQRARPRPKTPPRKRAMVTRWKKDEYRNVVTCIYMYVFFYYCTSDV